MLVVNARAGDLCAVVNVSLDGPATSDDYRALSSIGHYAMAFREANWFSSKNPAASREPYVPHVGARTIVCRIGQEQQVAAVVQHIISNVRGPLPEVDQ